MRSIASLLCLPLMGALLVLATGCDSLTEPNAITIQKEPLPQPKPPAPPPVAEAAAPGAAAPARMPPGGAPAKSGG